MHMNIHGAGRAVAQAKAETIRLKLFAKFNRLDFSAGQKTEKFRQLLAKDIHAHLGKFQRNAFSTAKDHLV
jgi:hypothetical protein